MTSSIEDELRAQVSEFAKSDEVLKEVIARLGELDSLISAHQLSRESLDSTSRSINQLVTNLGSLLTVSTSSVGDIARVSTEISAAIQRLEIEINKTITSNFKSVTDKIQNSVIQIEEVANSQNTTIKKLSKVVAKNAIITWVAISTTSLILIALMLSA
jgi:methyl-accepting chemotaxis protein